MRALSALKTGFCLLLIFAVILWAPTGTATAAETTEPGSARGADSHRGQVEYIRIGEVPLLSHVPAAGAKGLRAAILSRDATTGAETSWIDASPLWRWEQPTALSGDVELLLFEGDLAIAGQAMRSGDYLWIPAGTDLKAVESSAGARFLWMSTAALSASPVREDAAPVVLKRVREMEWSPLPGYEGRSVQDAAAGLSRKLLRKDPVTGAYTALVRHDAGFSDPRLEAHDTWEELLLLEGDYLMGDTGAITAGAYIFRPGALPHGPQASKNGAVWFVRGGRPIDFKLTHPTWTDVRIRAYFWSPNLPKVRPTLGIWSR